MPAAVLWVYTLTMPVIYCGGAVSDAGLWKMRHS